MFTVMSLKSSWPQERCVFHIWENEFFFSLKLRDEVKVKWENKLREPVVVHTGQGEGMGEGMAGQRVCLRKWAWPLCFCGTKLGRSPTKPWWDS